MYAYIQVSVNVGIKSKPGNISSIKEIAPAVLPVLPLYIFISNQAETGAQIISVNSPKPGIIYDIYPIASNNILKLISCIYLDC